MTQQQRKLRISLRRSKNGRANCAVFLSTLAIVVASTALWSTSRLLQLTSINHENSSVPDHAPSNVDRAVFYNVFIQPDERQEIGIRKGFKIVKEQLSQIQRSKYLKSSTIYYNMIGRNATDTIQQDCEDHGLRCEQLQYLEKADEGVTLDALFDYCLEHPESIVTYLHDKGSYHSKPENDKMRFMITKASVSDECQTMDADQCNVCSARLSFLPHMHFPGNMWTAHCSYIKQLIRPSEFPERMQRMVNELLEQKLFDMEAIDPNRKQHMVGVGRFAFEHWVASHPRIKPCDVYDGKKYMRAYSALPKWTEPWKPRLQQAGWIPLQRFPMFDAKGEWFCGKGRLYEFLHLYGMRPPADSFFYDQYTKLFHNCEPIRRPKPRPSYVAT